VIAPPARALERAGQHLLIIHGALHDLGSFVKLRSEFGRVTRNDPHVGVSFQEIF
jgi:hypothetical protein